MERNSSVTRHDGQLRETLKEAATKRTSPSVLQPCGRNTDCTETKDGFWDRPSASGAPGACLTDHASD